MKKRLCILLISAALLLAGCGAAETAAEGLAFPKVSYDSGPMPQPVPEEAETDSGGSDVSTHDVSDSIAAMNAVPASRIYDLPVMDAGYTADDVAVIGDALIAGDTDMSDYTLIWARFVNDGGEISVTERRVIMRGAEADGASAGWLCGMTATPEGDFLVLTGEPPRSCRAVTGTDSFADRMNPDYAGRYRLTRFSADGEALGSMELALPTDAAGRIWAAEGGRLFIEGGIISEARMPYQYFSGYYFSDMLLFTVDAATGGLLHTLRESEHTIYPLGHSSMGVYGAQLYGQVIVPSPSGASYIGALGFLDPAEETAAEAIEWDGTDILHPSTNENTAALTAGGSRTGDGSIVMNTAFTFGRYDAETGEYTTFLSAQPENESSFASMGGVRSLEFRTLCYLGGTTFIGAARSSDALYVITEK